MVHKHQTIIINNPSRKLMDLAVKLHNRKIANIEKLRNQNGCTFNISVK